MPVPGCTRPFPRTNSHAVDEARTAKKSHFRIDSVWRSNHEEEWNKVGSDFYVLYLGSPKTFCGIGKAFGEAMIELHRSRAKH